MGRGLLGGFGGGGDFYDGGPVGRVIRCSLAQDVFDLGETALVVRQDVVVFELFLFERADDGAVVRGGEAALLRDFLGEVGHLRLKFGEALMGHAFQFRRVCNRRRTPSSCSA